MGSSGLRANKTSLARVAPRGRSTLAPGPPATRLLVECKSTRTRASVKPSLANWVWQILDTDADGGFLVSPNGLQAGAKLVAAAADIHEIKLDPRSAPSAWFGEWLGKVGAGFADEVKVGVSEHVLIKRIDQNGGETVASDSSKDEGDK